MSNGNGHRWSKFWWQDWQNDPALKQCSFAAQGLWMRLLCLAHEATQRGSVLINGRMPTPKQLVAQVGGTEREVAKLLGELETEGVFSRDPDGTIYSRRMRRDGEASEAGREHIAKRWGGDEKTSLPNSPPNRGPTRKPNGEATTKPITRSLEAEEEAEDPPVGPPGRGAGTPAEPGTPPRRRTNGTNLRAIGANPRETGGNPRATGSSPRAQTYRNGVFTIIENDLAAEQKTSAIEAFVALAEVRHARR